MCVTDKTTFFPADVVGCTCDLLKAGKQVSSTIAAYEERDEGKKLVFFNHKDEAVLKLINSGEDDETEENAWHSVEAAVKIIFPCGESKIFYEPRPAAAL